jgi:hypothetical protein
VSRCRRRRRRRRLSLLEYLHPDPAVFKTWIIWV